MFNLLTLKHIEMKIINIKTINYVLHLMMKFQLKTQLLKNII